jgi:NTP pyrophosphatase (non-canonical NTP hydrolase)
MSNSGLTPYQEEVLTILAEECGETVQEVCKIMRFGYLANSHHVLGESHMERLEHELGDLLAMVDMIRDSTMGITAEGLEEAKQKKLEKVSKWMTHSKSTPSVIDSGEDKVAMVVEKTL